MGKTMEELESDIQTVTIGSEEWTGSLRDFAKKMGAETKFSATEAADALNYMALAGYDTKTSMETLPTVLNLAAAGGMDLATASDMVTDTQSALGLSLEETGVMVDQMAKAASKSNTSVAQLGDAMLKIGATARNIKGGTQELSTVLGVLADNGIKGSEGGTHLRNMLLSLQNPTDDAKGILDELGVSIYDSEGNMRSMIDVIGDLREDTEGLSQESKDAIVSGIFNKTDLAAVNALLGTSEERFRELSGAIGEASGAAKDMAETQLDNLSGDITIMQSAMEGLKIAISDGATPALRESVQGITEVIGGLNDLVSGVEGGSDRIKNGFAQVLAGIRTALPAIVEMFGSIMSAILEAIPDLVNSIVKILPSLFDKILTAIEGMIPNLMKVLPDLINVLADLGAKLAEHIPEILAELAKGIINCIPAILGSVGKLVDGIGKSLLGIKDPVDDINDRLSGIGETAQKSWDEISEAMSQQVDTSGILSSLGNTEAEIDGKINDIESQITGILKERLSEQQGLRESDIENIKKYLDEIRNLEEEKLSIYDSQAAAQIEIMKGMTDAEATEFAERYGKLQAYIQQEKDALEESYNARMVMADNAHTTMIQAAENYLKKQNGIEDEHYQNMISEAESAYQAAKDEAKKFYDEHIENIRKREAEGLEAATGAQNDYVDNIIKTFSRAAEANDTYWDALTGKLGDVRQATYEAQQEQQSAVNEMLEGLENGAGESATAWLGMMANIKAGGEDLSAEAKNTAELIVGAFENMPAGTQEAGKEALIGLASGMKDHIPELEDASEMSAKQIVEVIKKFLDINSPSRVMAEIGQNTAKGLAQGIKEEGSAAYGAMQEIGDNLVSGIGAGMQQKGNWLSNVAAQIIRNAIQAAKDAGKIESPSRIMRDEVGLMLTEGIGVGIADGEGYVTDAIGDLGSSIIDSAKAISLNSGLLPGYNPGAADFGLFNAGMVAMAMQGQQTNGSAAPVINITNYINGAESPVVWAEELVREIKLEMRA